LTSRLTGIDEAVWHGVYWARWGDALIEAGFAPNAWRGNTDTDFIVRKFIEAARHYGRRPAKMELRMYRRAHADRDTASSDDLLNV
jgi:hypothetical protein